jgi:hypothetical protein
VLPPGVNFANIYTQLFCTKVFCAAFMCLQLGCVISCKKKFGTKAAHKLLMKLTPGSKNWQLIIYPYWEKLQKELEKLNQPDPIGRRVCVLLTSTCQLIFQPF